MRSPLPSVPVVFAAAFASLAAASPTAANETTIDQIGTASTAIVAQGGGGGSVSVDQIGDGHSARVRDTGIASILTLDQTGTGQRADIRVGTASDGTVGSVEQYGSGGRVTATVTGIDNRFSVVQSGAAPNVLSVTQTGSGNRAAQIQTGGDNIMTLIQDGDGNDALLSQRGNDNIMRLEQRGNGNIGILRQEGTATVPLSVTQTGGMTATVTHRAAPSR